MLMDVLAILGLIASVVSSWLAWISWKAARDSHVRKSSHSLDRYLSVARIVKASRVARARGLEPYLVRKYSRRRLGSYRLRFWVARQALNSRLQGTPRMDLPGWVFLLLGPEDAERYRKEWGAHLWELIEAAELERARRDRRRLICGIFWLALMIRVHRVLTRARAR
jgi:hypothetical protein